MTATKVLSIILGVLLVIAGFVIIFYPSAGIELIALFAGIAMLVEGIGSICAYSNMKKTGNSDGWTLAGGIISVIIGLIVVFGPIAKIIASTIIVYFILAWLIIVGIMRIAGSLRLRKFVKANSIQHPVISWGWVLFLGILCVIVGILLVFQPMIAGLVLGMLVGIGVAASGCSLIAAGASL